MISREDAEIIYNDYLLKLAYEKMINENKLKLQVENWKTRGRLLVYPDQVGAWETYVENRSRDLFEGKDIEDAIVTMEALEDGLSLDDVLNEFKTSGNTTFYDKIVTQTVGYFSKRGEEFYKQIYLKVFNEKLDESMLNFISQIKNKNEKSKQLLQGLQSE